MIITHKNIVQHETTLAFPKENNILVNNTTNEVYILVENWKTQISQENIALIVQELVQNGFEIKKLNGISGSSITIKEQQQVKYLTLISPNNDNCSYILWQTPVID